MVKRGNMVFIDVLAHISGDVTLGDNVNIWPGASIRGDRSKIIIGKNSNVQDNATIHSENFSKVVLGENVTVGHNAIVHGALVGDNTVIGMGAIVLDNTVIGKNCIIGAGAVISGNKNIPDNSVVVGNPYKIIRETTERDIEANKNNALEYVKEASKLFNII